MVLSFPSWIQTVKRRLRPQAQGAKADGAVDAVKEHKEIYEALKRRDADLAEELTVRHIKNAKENLINILSVQK